MNLSCKHDYHLHTNLSSCAAESLDLIPANIYQFALDNGYDSLCIADHTWDAAIPDPINFYAKQPVERTLTLAPLPKGRIPFYFGCETEFCGDRLGLSPASFDKFDFIVIPPNHFHMVNFVRPETCNTVETIAELFTRRMELLAGWELPFEKVGIAHMNCRLMSGNVPDVNVLDILHALDRDRMARVLRTLAAKGAGIELNLASFESYGDDALSDDSLNLFRLARDCGCKFYCASDAHSMDALKAIPRFGPTVIEALELREEDRYHIPALAER